MKILINKRAKVAASAWDDLNVNKRISDLAEGIDVDAKPESIREYVEQGLYDLASDICNYMGMADKIDSVYKQLLPTADKLVNDLANAQNVRNKKLNDLGSSENTKIREWYMRTYPDDSLGSELNPDSTFYDLFYALDRHKDVYEVLGESDSVIRERAFEELAKIMDVDYDYIYNQWLS